MLRRVVSTKLFVANMLVTCYNEEWKDQASYLLDGGRSEQRPQAA